MHGRVKTQYFSKASSNAEPHQCTPRTPRSNLALALPNNTPGYSRLRQTTQRKQMQEQQRQQYLQEVQQVLLSKRFFGRTCYTSSCAFSETFTSHQRCSLANPTSTIVHVCLQVTRPNQSEGKVQFELVNSSPTFQASQVNNQKLKLRHFIASTLRPLCEVFPTGCLASIYITQCLIQHNEGAPRKTPSLYTQAQELHRAEFNLDLQQRIAVCTSWQQLSELVAGLHQQGGGRDLVNYVSVAQLCGCLGILVGPPEGGAGGLQPIKVREDWVSDMVSAGLMLSGCLPRVSDVRCSEKHFLSACYISYTVLYNFHNQG